MITTSIFDKYVKPTDLQAVIDTSQDLLYGFAAWRRFLDWGIPQSTLEFSGVKGRTRLVSAASVVEPDAPAPLRGRDNFGTYSGKIPTMKEKFSLDQKEYRALKHLQGMPISDESKKAAFYKLFYDDTTNAAKSTDVRIDIFFLQMLSTLKVAVTLDNNPDGVVYAEVDFSSGPHQFRAVKKVWTDLTADIFADIEATVAYARTKGQAFSRMLIDPATWALVKKNTSVLQAITGYNNPGSNNKYLINLDSINEYLTQSRLPIFEIYDQMKVVEKDGYQTPIRPFRAENVVFIPDGKLGLVHNAVAIEEWEPITGINYAKYDKALLSKWADNDPWREYTQVELNAFPSLDMADNIYIQQTNVVEG